MCTAQYEMESAVWWILVKFNHTWNLYILHIFWVEEARSAYNISRSNLVTQHITNIRAQNIHYTFAQKYAYLLCAPCYCTFILFFDYRHIKIFVCATDQLFVLLPKINSKEQKKKKIHYFQLSSSFSRCVIFLAAVDAEN